MIRLRRPSWFAVALTVAGAGILSTLGVWQLHRAAEKQAMLDRFATASSAPAVAFSSLPDSVPESRNPHVLVHGQWLADRVYILDDQSRQGKRGVQVFAPLQLSCAAENIDDCARDAPLLLVGLGFLARTEGPRSVPQRPELAPGSITLDGLYAPPPGSGLRLGGNPLARQSAWPKLTTWLDLDQISADLGRDVFPRVLLLDAVPTSPYIRQWSPQTMPPAKHFGYALQWFALALVALAIFVVMHRKRPENTRKDKA